MEDRIHANTSLSHVSGIGQFTANNFNAFLLQSWLW
jgi:hypothetical protein